MHRWASVSENDQTARYERFAKYLNSQSIPNEFVPEKINPSEFIENFEKMAAPFHSLRLDAAVGETLLKKINNFSVSAHQTHVCDTLIQRQKRFWPECAASNSLARLIVHEIVKPNLKSGALLIGSSAETRAAAVACVRAGFLKIAVTDLDERRGKDLTAELQKIFLGISAEFLTEASLMELPGIYGLAVNTIVTSEQNSLLSQLSYFNFLGPNPALIDFSCEESQLQKEARGLGAQIVAGDKVFAYQDAHWAELVLGKKINIDHFIRG